MNLYSVLTKHNIQIYNNAQYKAKNNEMDKMATENKTSRMVLLKKKKKKNAYMLALTLKWSRWVPMDPKSSFRASARKRRISWHCHFLSYICFYFCFYFKNIGMLTMLAKLKHFVPENMLYSLYCTLILPYINSRVLIWGDTCKTYLIRYLRVISGNFSI